VPRHVARLVTRLVPPLVVGYSASRSLVIDNSASRWLVVDYFSSAARPGASARVDQERPSGRWMTAP
jgi:hypothetical protein